MIASVLDGVVPVQASWQRWCAREPALDQPEFHALRLELMNRATSYDRRDTLLAALVRIAKDDHDAQVVIVAVLMPGLRKAVGRYGQFLEIEERWATILLGLCERLDRYDLERRPHHVASNLLWDATAVLLAASRREEHHAEHATVLNEEDILDDHDTSPARDVLQPAVAAGVITRLDAALIDATRLRGVDLHATAQLLGLSYEAAKKRRRRAEVAWAEWWDPNRDPTTDSTLSAA